MPTREEMLSYLHAHRVEDLFPATGRRLDAMEDHEVQLLYELTVRIEAQKEEKPRKRWPWTRKG
jgi:hypothetical protein